MIISHGMFLNWTVSCVDHMISLSLPQAKYRRRIVCGLREVLKHLKLKKLKCVILPPNLDSISSEGKQLLK